MKFFKTLILLAFSTLIFQSCGSLKDLNSQREKDKRTIEAQKQTIINQRTQIKDINLQLGLKDKEVKDKDNEIFTLYKKLGDQQEQINNSILLGIPVINTQLDTIESLKKTHLDRVNNLNAIIKEKEIDTTPEERELLSVWVGLGKILGIEEFLKSLKGDSQ